MTVLRAPASSGAARGAAQESVRNADLRAEAIAGLTARKKSLAPKWLYDERGSALFERITGLPEYYPTRTETAILRRHAAQLGSLVPPGGALVELGSGASLKTRILLDAGAHFGAYVPIDISPEFLTRTAEDLRRRYRDLPIIPLTGDFSRPLNLPGAALDLPKIGFFPGSTIGNLDPAAARALLERVRGWPGTEGFILGVDLVKDPEELVAAYDDAQGVTAAFISNILVRLNREAGANFDPDAFAYEALWNAELARIDMRLVSTRKQVVDLSGTRIDFAADEPIHVSASRKYTGDSLAALATASGWRVAQSFADEGNRFLVACLVPGRPSSGTES